MAKRKPGRVKPTYAQLQAALRVVYREACLYDEGSDAPHVDAILNAVESVLPHGTAVRISRAAAKEWNDGE